MKVIMLMFDSLNRHMLPCYGCDWTKAPNFARLAQRTVTFDRSYVCSMPCMPARRDLHTGRPNFLHRSWGPLEPFDDSVPQMLKANGVYTHLATDHYHYFEDGGSTYHNRYSTWEFFRGQEGDPWIGQVKNPEIPETVAGDFRKGAVRWRQDWINRQFMGKEELQPQPQTVGAGLEFIRRNRDQDRWFLQMETFDPHEPFFTQQHYKDLYPHAYEGPHFDWPPYRAVQESREQVEHCKLEYAALLSMCDAHLGKVLDLMDELKMWDDTMLIVWTDHGFMLGEHECWAKCWQPFYEEIAHTPFFVWDPRCRAQGQRRQSLVQPSIDLGPTLLEFFGLEPTAHMTGRALGATIAGDRPVREAALFGIHGGQVNVTDGRYVYMRGPAGETNSPLNQYTLMPAHMYNLFSPGELSQTTLCDDFSFAKGSRLMKIPQRNPALVRQRGESLATRLFDLQVDPQQRQAIANPQVEARMIELMASVMKGCEAPAEQYERLGIRAG
ncbi:MAG: sulfatase [Phycisphaeraceae bacterium]|nr:sulfatase [Phycisphaeraceae bacterium]